MALVRRDVRSLTSDEGDWPSVLVAYEHAVHLLRGMDPLSGGPADPLGWRFLAAMHGRALPDGNPDTSNDLWNNCQHGSWFFFPWHRMYLRAFEMIVQHVLGDETWALPYWYSVDPDDPASSILPSAFREARDDNSLYTRSRSLLANGGDPLPDLSQSLVMALDADVFSTPSGTSTFGGGERSEPDFNADELGLLEGAPHGGVHVLVGNDYRGNTVVRRGWMGSPYTAALDPIFWLHHANIDRIWQMWIDLDPDGHVNPENDPAWANTTFSFPQATGGLVTWAVGDVVEAASLGYEYESVAPPSGVAVPAGPVEALEPGDVTPEAAMADSLPPRVIGSAVDVPLTSTEPVEVELAAPADLLAPEPAAGGARPRTYLRVERITGSAAAPIYDVYLNVPAGEPPGDHPELRVGQISTFGLEEASQRNELVDGSGVTAAFEITAVRELLEGQGRWDAGRLRVSFDAVVPTPSREALAGQEAGLADVEDVEEPAPADIRAGQLTVVTG